MDKKVLRVGIVGCGEIAQVAHLPLLQELPNLEVTAICDLSEKILNYLGPRYNIEKRYTDYHDLVKSDDVDIVLVTTRDHAPVTIAAMNAGKHVFCEKPMCFNVEEADAIIAAEKASGVKYMVGMMKRQDPAYQYVLPLIKELDDVHLVRVHDFGGDYTINGEIYDEVRNDDLPQEVRDEMADSDMRKMIKGIGEDRKELGVAYSTLLYLMVHDAILLQEAFGRPTEIQYADVYNNDTILAVLKFGEDIRCVYEGGLLLKRRDWDERFEVFSDSKRISVQFPFPYIKNAQTLVKINEQDVHDPKANVDKTVYVSYDEAFKREWRHFYECITEDKEPFTNSEKARNDIELSANIIKAVKI
ncbi:Gfo/Idh/MocA family oxidoreductase [Chloroflexota bacterium]|nr:Gfo/Idh/MocA family oxidoreductase [Chloroflexota bacterium]